VFSKDESNDNHGNGGISIERNIYLTNNTEQNRKILWRQNRALSHLTAAVQIVQDIVENADCHQKCHSESLEPEESNQRSWNMSSVFYAVTLSWMK